MERKKVLELDKICRVCISERKDMRPLYNEKVAEMLMECTSVTVRPTEGWPDKICVQCVHSVSRCHAFKALVERSDRELREYIKSLTVRVVIEEDQKMQKLQQSKAKLFKLQQQQQVLIQQQQEQQQQKQQQKLMQKQLKQQQQQQQILLQQQEQLQQEQLQQQQLQQQLQQQQQQEQEQHLLLKKKAVASARRAQRQQRKQQQLQQQQQQQLEEQQRQQQLQQQQQEEEEQQQLLQQHQQQQQEEEEQQLAMQQQQQQQHQQQQQQLLPGTATTATTTALPQQLLLPNGQIITTAQIVTHNGQPAQLASVHQQHHHHQQHAAQQQYAPQFIQTTNGQTLQLIQQPNGQHALQLVQLVPQRALNTVEGSPHDDDGSGCGVLDEEMTTLVDEEALIDESLIEEAGPHLIDDGDEEEEEEGEECGEQDQICDTIGHTVVIEDDDNLTQSDTQELEYLEDITVTTTSSGAHHHHHHHHQQHHQHQHHHQMHMADDMGDGGGQLHLTGQSIDEDDDIIEEIHMEEEMLDDDCSNDMHMHEFIAEDDDGGAGELQYTVMTLASGDGIDDDEDAQVEADVSEVLQAACGGGASGDGADLNLSASSTLDYSGQSLEGECDTALLTPIEPPTTLPTRPTTPPARKPAPRKNSSKALANSRQLVATASSIAAAGGDDDFEIDSKFIAEFISQQTTSLGAGRYYCNLCRQEFKQFKGLQNHMHLHSNWIRANCKKQPQCDICYKSFKGPGMLKMHMKTHQSAARTPICNICSKSFKSKAILYRHRQTHWHRAYACAVDNCRKTFSGPLTLRAHTARKHSDIELPHFRCGECRTLFDDVDVLHTHVQMTGHGAAGSSPPPPDRPRSVSSTGSILVVTHA